MSVLKLGTTRRAIDNFAARSQPNLSILDRLYRGRISHNPQLFFLQLRHDGPSRSYSSYRERGKEDIAI